jgi:hypothetical protein
MRDTSEQLRTTLGDMRICIWNSAMVGRDSVVGIVTHYGLDGPGIESRRGRDFQHPSWQALEPTQPPV